MTNLCIKCGTPRIDGKSWESKNGNSVIVHTQTICPDPQCQKLVDKAIADRKEKSNLLAEERMKSKLAREKLMASEAKATV